MIRIKFLFLIAIGLSAVSFVVNASDLNECYSEDESNKDTLPTKTIDCKTINADLANCTCTAEMLDCSDKNFHSIPTDLKKIPSTMKRLLFAKNKISSLDGIELNEDAKISVINLKKNIISKINSEKFFSPQLAKSLYYLSLCGNKNLNDLNSAKAEFSELYWLEANHVTEQFSINDGFFNKEKFPSLAHLDLSFANLKFKKLPFDKLDKLNLLRLDSNNLNELPCESLNQLPALDSLSVNNNSLSKMTEVSEDCLTNSKDLRSLHLKKNGLTEENLAWMNLGRFKKLTTLDLSENKFTRMPYTTFKDTQSIESLKIELDETEFSKPPSNKVAMPNLVYLDFTGSRINKLSNNSFENVAPGVSTLILKDVNLKTIEPDAFVGLHNLNSLDLSNNNLRILHKPSNLVFFNNMIQGNINLKENEFDCITEIEWFTQFYEFPKFDQNITCHLVNGTKIPVRKFINTTRATPSPPEKTNKYNILAIILLVLIVLVVAMGAVYIVKRKQMKQRQQQYRYRYFTERSQDDGFDTDNVPVYRDCTVSLRIKEGEENNIVNNNTDSSAQLTEQQAEVLA